MEKWCSAPPTIFDDVIRKFHRTDSRSQFDAIGTTVPPPPPSRKKGIICCGTVKKNARKPPKKETQTQNGCVSNFCAGVFVWFVNTFCYYFFGWFPKKHLDRHTSSVPPRNCRCAAWTGSRKSISDKTKKKTHNMFNYPVYWVVNRDPGSL